MELKNILSGLEGLKVKGDLTINIENVDSDSRNIKKNGMFVAIKGFDVDGHNYIKEAIKKGAIAVIASLDIDKKLLKEIMDQVTIILAPDTRLALAICACNFYDNPSRKFKLVGITGTKGKTTTSFMVKRILEKSGKKVGLVGTIATYIGDKKLEDSDRTTPESLKLQQIFNRKNSALHKNRRPPARDPTGARGARHASVALSFPSPRLMRADPPARRRGIAQLF